MYLLTLLIVVSKTKKYCIHASRIILSGHCFNNKNILYDIWILHTMHYLRHHFNNLFNHNQSLVRGILVVLILMPGICLRLWQILHFNIIYGYDGSLHLQYITSLYKTGNIPSPYSFLEAYQPPLYYWVCSLLMRLCTDAPLIRDYIFKNFSILLGFSLFFIGYGVYMTISDLFKDRKKPLWYGLICMMYLPVHLYISPMIGNEMLSAVLISVSLWIFMRCIKKRCFSTKYTLLLGTSLGLSLLTKYTGLLMLATTIMSFIVLLLYKPIPRFVIIRFALLASAVAIAISGWWYVRNAMLYGDPFIKSNDLEDFSYIYKNQQPGHRSLSDFFTFDFEIFNEPAVVLKQTDIYNPVYNNVLTGTFATIWIDNHLLYLKLKDKISFTLAKYLLVVGLVVVCFSLFGLCLLLWRSIRSKNFEMLPMFILVALSICGYVIYNYRYPYFCHVKAFFLMHLSIPVILGYCCAVQTILNKNKFVSCLYHVMLAAQILLVILLYGFYARY